MPSATRSSLPPTRPVLRAAKVRRAVVRGEASWTCTSRSPREQLQGRSPVRGDNQVTWGGRVRSSTAAHLCPYAACRSLGACAPHLSEGARHAH
eukprot:scaffold23007_cov60-Phaeocystis_antarctica.AAC.10